MSTDKVAGVLAFVIPCALLGATMQTDVQYWDVGELQTVPYIFGIAHPTGFPVYVILGWVLSHALPFASVAARMSLLSVLATASSAWLAYGFTRRVTGSAYCGLAASLVFAATLLVWTRGTRADVHPLALTFAAGAFYAAYRFSETGESRFFYLVALLDGLALGTHPVAAFSFPAQFVFVASRLKGLAFRNWAIGAALATLGLCAYLYMPLRSAQLSATHADPTLALGYDAGMPFWDYGHTSDFAKFVVEVTGSQFNRGQGFQAYLLVQHYAEYARLATIIARRNVGLPILVIAAFGLLALWFRRDRIPAGALTLFAVACVPFALGYQEESDQQRYLLQTMWGIACSFGAGLAALRSSFGERARWADGVAGLVGASLIARLAYQSYVVGGIPAINGDARAREYLQLIRRTTPDDAIVVSAWFYATPVAYGAYAERTLGRRIIVTAEPAGQIDAMREFSDRRCVVVALPRGARLSRDDIAVRTLGGTDPQLASVSATGSRDLCL